jgi:hypothetical protein
MKTIHNDEQLVSLSFRQMEQLRKKLRERLSRGELEQFEQWEALERLFTASQVDPATFHHLWIQPLLAAGLGPEDAIVQIVGSYCQPN